MHINDKSNNDDIVQKLVAGRKLFFTVTAKNSQGGATKATCELPTYDMTLPGGRVMEEFRASTRPDIIWASLLAVDDSRLTIEQVRIVQCSNFKPFSVSLYGVFGVEKMISYIFPEKCGKNGFFISCELCTS